MTQLLQSFLFKVGKIYVIFLDVIHLNLHVYITAKPMIHEAGPHDDEVLEYGTSKELICIFDGIPKPEVNWFLNGALFYTTDVRTS